MPSYNETRLVNMIECSDYDGFVDLVEKENLDLSLTTFTGRNLLQVCITWNIGQNLDIIDYILYNCPKLVKNINRADRHGRTAIYEACYMARYDVAVKLLTFGADYKSVNENMLGLSGPHACMMRGKYWAIHKLIEAGVDTVWLRNYSDEILRKHTKIDVKLIDEISENILFYHEVTVPRIKNFFYLLNTQINYVDFKRRSYVKDRKEVDVDESENTNKKTVNSMKYKTLLGRIPKHA